MKPLLLALICFSLAAASCGEDPRESARRHFTAGERYLDKKQFSEAIIEYRGALQQDANLAVARLKLARAYVATNDYVAAFTEYKRVGDLLPDDLDVQVEVGNMLLLARQFEDAKSRARAILQKDRSHRGALILLGNALAGLQDFDNAVSVSERAASLDATHYGGQMNLGVMHLARGDRAAAAEAFAQAVAIDPKSVRARLSLANFHRAVGDLEAAKREFTHAVELDPSSFQANRAIASFYIEANLKSLAEPYLRRVAESINDASSWLELADLLVADGRPAEALVVLEKVAADPRTVVVAKTRTANVMHALGQTIEAHKVIAGILNQNPSNAAALALDARLLLTEGRVDQALARGRAALQADPTAIDAHFVLGRIYVARKEVESARRSFTEAINLDRAALEPRIELSKLHLERRETDTAIQIANDAVRFHPNSIEARMALIRALAARPEDRPKALREAEQLVKEHPSSAAARTALGQFYIASRNPTAARREFERALDIDGAYLEALAPLVAIDLSTGRSLDARKRLAEQLRQRPDNTAILLMSAKVLMTLRQFPEAEQLLRRVIERDRSSLESFALLGQLFLTQKRLPEATREFKAMAERDPKSSGVHTMLGLLFHVQKQVAEAVKEYEKALEVDPRAATAANNLAWLLAENDQQLDRAQQLAQAAKGQVPTNPEIIDTLGWVYVKRGMLTLATPALEEAARLAPANPLYAYHLGVAYAKNGDDARARKALERAVSLRPDFERATDAKKLLATLVY